MGTDEQGESQERVLYAITNSVLFQSFAVSGSVTPKYVRWYLAPFPCLPCGTAPPHLACY